MMPSTKPIVSTEWLAVNLGESNVRVVDATYHVLHPVGVPPMSNGPPRSKRDQRVEFAEAHIPGAVFFDVEEIADTEASLPMMLPSPERFERLVGALGIGNDDLVVAYGASHLILSARVWCSA